MHWCQIEFFFLFILKIHFGSGQFEITENGVTVVSGVVRDVENTNSVHRVEHFDKEGCAILDKKDFYKELRLRGYHYQHMFQGIERARGDGRQAIIKWYDNWPAFLDSMLQVNDIILLQFAIRIALYNFFSFYYSFPIVENFVKRYTIFIFAYAYSTTTRGFHKTFIRFIKIKPKWFCSQTFNSIL